jgi:threonine dehydrogenase-like Zn-dependent dehydrogenase
MQYGSADFISGQEFQIMSGKGRVKALQCSGVNELELVEFEKPDPAADSALLRVRLCGICGSDMHGIEGKRKVNYPFIPGHEIVAEVDELGENAGTTIKVFGGNGLAAGDRVVVNPRIVCGKCFFCVNFPLRQELCTDTKTATSMGSASSPHLLGGWGEYLYVLPHSDLISIPDTLSDEMAVLAEPFTCATGCVDRYRKEHEWRAGDAFAIDETVVIIGAGAVGILSAASFHLAGAKTIIAVDVNSKRLSLSKEFGATNVIDASVTGAEERIAAVKDLSGGLGAGVVIEACGVPEAVRDGLLMLRRGGKLFELGHAFDAGTVELNPHFICRNEVEIAGYYAYPSSNSIHHAVRLLNDHGFPYEKLVRLYELRDFRSVIFEKAAKDVIKPAFRMSS